jgi:hypothetical protein
MPKCGQIIALDRDELKRQMKVFGGYVPEETEGARVSFTNLRTETV